MSTYDPTDTTDDTTGTPDEVGPAAGIVPGVGPTPEPEPEGFRDELIEKEQDLRERQQREAAERSREADAHYSGREPAEDETAAE